MQKNPILKFSIFIFPITLILTFLLFGFWGIGSLIWLWGIYILLIGISYLLKLFKVKYRPTIEIMLIFLYLAFHTLYFINWNVGTKIYFHEEKEAFIGDNKSFIIVFNVKGEEKLPNNFLTDNKIYIPKNGILLTSSDISDYKQRYSFPIAGTIDKFVTSGIEKFSCYGFENYQFEYIIGSYNNKGILDYNFRDSITNTLCQLIENKTIENKSTKGYENGKSYLDQNEIYINNQNLTSLPKGIQALSNITYLNIHSNNFQQFPEEIFHFTNLKDLTIGFNNIDSIPRKIIQLKSLEYLAVNGNNLKDLPDELLQLPKLKTIYARENKFDSLKIKELTNKYNKKGIKVQFE